MLPFILGFLLGALTYAASQYRPVRRAPIPIPRRDDSTRLLPVVGAGQLPISSCDLIDDLR